MAQKQISRIQHRRGPQVDLSGVTLNAGEIGWTIDERRIFIGNRIEDGAPADENVEILTEFSSIPYDYIEDITPVRDSESRLRDRASIQDFGLDSTDTAIDQTLAFQEAADRLYNPLFTGTVPYDNAAIYMPSFTYEVDTANYATNGTTVTTGIRLYPNMTLIGESSDTTVITSNSSVSSILESATNTGETGANMTTETMTNVYIKDLTFRFDSGAVSPLMSLKNYDRVFFINCQFIGTGTTASAISFVRDAGYSGAMGNVIFDKCTFSGFATIFNLADTAATNNRDYYFNRCIFKNSTNGIIVGVGIKNFQVVNSIFNNITNVAYDIANTDFGGMESRGNHYQSCGTGLRFNANSFENVSFMDTFEACTTNITWNDAVRNIVLGVQENYGIGNGRPTEVTMGTTGSAQTFLTIPHADLSVFEFNYSLVQNSVERMGRFRVITDGTSAVTDDDFIEVGGVTTLVLSATVSGANLLIQYNATTNVATFLYRLTTWLN